MKPVTAILLGAGSRGMDSLASYAERFPYELKFVAVAEPDEHRRSEMARRHDIPVSQMYATWEDALAKPKFADMALICTQDRMHYEPTMKALALGYHILLEKPMSPSPKECIEMEEEAAKQGRLLSICHVLRYTPFWSSIKRVIDEGKIGDIVSLQLSENVGYSHMAHSFVRGNWNNSAVSSPMILAKSCHDMDIISYLIGKSCERVSSFGSLMHFHEGNAPEGSTDRCLSGCAAEAKCPFSAPRFYLGEGRNWARKITNDPSKEGILKALQEGPYGKCVYHSDNNVVDHQVVNLLFEGGATATFSMCGFTHDISRTVQIMGTKGEIRGYMEKNMFTVHDFVSKREEQVKVHISAEGHGGGDEGIMRSFVQEVRQYNGGEGLTSAAASVRSHMMAFAAEQSRLEGGIPVVLDQFKLQLA
ncbi:Oxidoreductase family, C-terminal alpha/beta domain [Paenibacillus catalpae]|uniref:Oxidoreductase family, C-terminal alpha/beta domain n=1 Tax=Paenibacillus catalpae TaxID=1045775 RepID=A0A1I1SRJ5_9BACL|nr:Gfo/Idh/MocA family oxidoreductase [Paenibacillus catalpae]SFD49046.1 Oxidoreductase family, C-terminal alpha/beta domain [Paenibacillus catalpae]